MRDPRLARESERALKPDVVGSIRAAARDIALAPPDVSALRNAVEGIDLGWDAFHEAFREQVRLEGEERKRAWVAALRAAIRDGLADPLGLVFKTDRERVSAELEFWDRTSDPYVLWEFARGDVTYHPYPETEFRFLLDLDLQAWLGEIDRLPLPSLIWFVIWFSPIVEDPELIKELMARAPPLLDEQGNWTRSIAVLILVYLIRVYAERVYGAVQKKVFAAPEGSSQHASAERELDELAERELPLRLREFYGKLLARPDGQNIAYRLLSDLARNAFRTRQAKSTRPRTADSVAFDALALALAASGVSVDDVQKNWQELNARREQEALAGSMTLRLRGSSRKKSGERKGEGGRKLYADGLPLLLGAWAVLSSTSTPYPQDEVDRVWSWFEELLTGRDPGLSMAANDPVLGHVSGQIGAVLASVTEPAGAWRKAYRALEPQRRRGLFGFRYEGDGYYDRESVLLIYVGLYGCAAWVGKLASGESREPMHDLFWSLYDSARRLWLTAAHDTGKHRRDLVAACSAFVPAIFGEASNSAIERALRPLANDSWLYIRACTYLRLNGIEPERLKRIAARAGLELSTALSAAHEWSALTGQADEFPQDFGVLAEAVGCELGGTASAQPEPLEVRQRHHRSAFEERVSWGAALLARLKQDGFGLVHIEPLDERGAGWLLQVKAPHSIEEAFGVAPEVRILAAAGWFDGQSLERAQGKPEGMAAVDPDLIVIANDRADLAERLSLLPGPWGQRIPWPMGHAPPAPLGDQLRAHLPEFDLFERRDPVRGRQLVGRRKVIADLSSRLARGQAVGVFGLRKVGKSSLLGAVVEALDPASSGAPDAEVRALVVFVDVQGITEPTLDAVARRVAEGLRERLDRAGLLHSVPTRPGELVVSEPATPAAQPLEELGRLIRLALARSSGPICVVLDEYDLLFEGYGGEPGVGGIERLFGLLRALAQETRRVALAVIGRDPVFMERPLMGGFTSPMLGWAAPFWLGPLLRDEADELLSRLGRRVGLAVGRETLEVAWRWSGGHPLLHRQFGSALLEVARERDGSESPVPTDPLCEDAIRVFMDRDAVHTITTEVKALLASRFPEALALLQELAAANGEGSEAALEPHGGWNGDAARALRNFGLIAGTSEHPTMAEAVRRRIGRPATARRPGGPRRALRHGS